MVHAKIFRVFEDFSGSKNNRFRTLSMAHKNRIVPPGSILHIFNLPPELNTVEQIELTFTELGAAKPKNVKIFVRDANNNNSNNQPQQQSNDNNNNTSRLHAF